MRLKVNEYYSCREFWVHPGVIETTPERAAILIDAKVAEPYKEPKHKTTPRKEAGK